MNYISIQLRDNSILSASHRANSVGEAIEWGVGHFSLAHFLGEGRGVKATEQALTLL